MKLADLDHWPAQVGNYICALPVAEEEAAYYGITPTVPDEFEWWSGLPLAEVKQLKLFDL